MESFHGWKRKKCHKNIHNGAVTAQKERESVSRFPLKQCLLIGVFLAEVALQQALESLAVAGLVAGHLVDGVVDSIQVQLLGLLGQLELTGGGAVLGVDAHLQVLLGGVGDHLAQQLGELGGVLGLLIGGLLPVQAEAKRLRRSAPGNS